MTLLVILAVNKFKYANNFSIYSFGGIAFGLFYITNQSIIRFIIPTKHSGIVYGIQTLVANILGRGFFTLIKVSIHYGMRLCVVLWVI